jgi:protein-tyrosine phosphatase
VRRESVVAVWVGPKSGDRKTSKGPVRQGQGGLSPKTREELEKRSSGRTEKSQRQLGTAARITRYRMGMDITWLTDARDPRTGRIAVGGGIWNSRNNMEDLKTWGITHIINMQVEVEDEEALGREHGIEVLWNPTHDDFEPKGSSLFEAGVKFAAAALKQENTKLFIHCAAGVHRAPMMALAVLGSMGWDLEKAQHLIEDRRPVADFAEVYVESVEKFLRESELNSPR